MSIEFQFFFCAFACDRLKLFQVCFCDEQAMSHEIAGRKWELHTVMFTSVVVLGTG